MTHHFPPFLDAFAKWVHSIPFLFSVKSPLSFNATPHKYRKKISQVKKHNSPKPRFLIRKMHACKYLYILISPYPTALSRKTSNSWRNKHGPQSPLKTASIGNPFKVPNSHSWPRKTQLYKPTSLYTFIYFQLLNEYVPHLTWSQPSSLPHSGLSLSFSLSLYNLSYLIVTPKKQMEKCEKKTIKVKKETLSKKKVEKET